MKLRAVVFKAVGWYYDKQQGKDYPRDIEVRAEIGPGEVLTVTDVTFVEGESR